MITEMPPLDNLDRLAANIIVFRGILVGPMFVIVSWAIERNLSLFRANLVESVIVKVSWAVWNNLVYFWGYFSWSLIVIVFWSHRWDAVNNLVYFRKDLIVNNSYLLFSRWLYVYKDYLYSLHKQQGF